MKNLVETAIESGKFNTLIKVIRETDLFDTLSKEGPYTIFAPTDEAFSRLPSKTFQDFLTDKEKLTEVLTSHVIAKKVMSSEVVNIKSVKMVNGKKINIKKSKCVKIGKAKVTETDIECSNGVIHAIDKLLIPIKT
jgi:uncharacterized surface protein with fasciclin (FAS1) repeats